MIGGTMPGGNVADLNSEEPRLSIHLACWASRLTLIVSDVKVGQLQDINGANAEGEGVDCETADPPFWYRP
jgi:hypothetical protein